MVPTKTSPFKLFIFAMFFLFAAIGVVMFALYQAGDGSDKIGTVTMWGTIPEEQFDGFINELSFTNELADNLIYSYIPEDRFNTELIEALASGTGPDILLITNERIMHHRNRVFATPYEQYDVRQFKNTYIESAEALLLPEGIIGIPVAIDPLVLYWNRTILANNQYSLPPKQWGELFKMSQKITKRTDEGNIILSTIALGEFENIKNAKDIFVAILMQGGGNIVRVDGTGNQVSSLQDRNTRGTSPAQDALRFYTGFADPTKVIYTWSKAQPEARDAFIAEELAMYIGYASELPLILAKNPNLNFDVATLPQQPGNITNRQSTLARIYTLAIPKVAENTQGAGILVGVLTSKYAAELFEKHIGLPSPRRDLLAKEPKDALKTTFRNSAIIARSWLDPNPQETYKIIRKMVEDVVSGVARMSQAISRADRELQVLLGE